MSKDVVDDLRRDLEAIAGSAAARHLPEPGGCICGFCAWSVEHVAIMVVRDALMPHIERAIWDKE